MQLMTDTHSCSYCPCVALQKRYGVREGTSICSFIVIDVEKHQKRSR